MSDETIKNRNVSKYILIVEDDDFILDVYEKKLALEGYSIAIARNGNEAMELIRKRRPDLLLLDIMLPLKDGFQVLKEIREDEELTDIRVIVMSNLSQNKDMARAKELGVTDYIVKSNISLPDMVERVRKAMFSE